MKIKIHPKLFVLVGIVLIYNIIFPLPGVPKKFDIKEGQIAPYNVIAPYDFYIPKSEQELFREKQEIARRIPPVYELDKKVSDLIAKKIDHFEYVIDSLKRLKLKPDSLIHLIQREYAVSKGVLRYLLKNNYKKILSQMKESLSKLYANGIIEEKSGQNKIITILSGNKEIIESTDSLYSLTQAESIATHKRGNEYRALVRFFLMPNITYNPEKTEQRIDELFANIPKTKGKVLKGEFIIEKHRKVSKSSMEKLFALENTYISIGTWEVIKTIVARNLFLFALIFLIFQYARITDLRLSQDKNIYFLGLLSGVYLVIGKVTSITNSIYALPIAFFIFLITLYFNVNTAILFTLVFSSIFGIILNSLPIFIYLLVGGLVAVFSIQTISTRLSLYRPFLYIAGANVLAIIFIDIYLLKTQINLFYLGMGILNSVLVIVLFALFLPPFEKIFDFTTDLTLLELGNLNLPIFKEMAIEAPGTYHHSIVTGNLAEAGARAIGADPVLARVGAYYHDIGKLKKPDYFIENQIGLKNPHDTLKPQMSALIIISHVKDGVEMAKQMGLPRSLIEIIEQHHGTTTIEWFYKKAMKIKADIDEDTFRYPGPKPKTKESALVMLADSVEATARSEKSVTVAKLTKILRDTIERKFNDGQLDDCPINRYDLEQIKTAFLPILTGVFHPRVEYKEKKKRQGNQRGDQDI
ncbi:hypothetical protein BXT86_02300 [candidate division WOR-3 bacterium 4484_100]|uniref:HD/PDEase domain-containing protein n=1 Tax=candidate division WOR-3 bacterium 4484_100 TaxID=1936077 RepID=A0A1V4QFT6_UNCW3|nr:MAG: hypothetical protein BXT86_02300 [candidate division WOR-3 bacterium 4484_100]